MRKIQPLLDLVDNAQLNNKAWGGYYAGRTALGREINSQTITNQGVQGSIALLAQQMQALTAVMSKLTPGSQTYNQYSGQIAGIQNQIMAMRFDQLKPTDLPNQLQQILEGGETAFSIASTIGPHWGMYSNLLRLGYTDTTKSPRQMLRSLIGGYGQAIDFYRAEYQQKEDDLTQMYRRGEVDETGYRAELANIRKLFQATANPYRTQMAGALSMAESGWMERAISATWGTPGRVAGVMRQFNYAGAAGALESRGLESNRFFGGKNISFSAADFPILQDMSDANTGRSFAGAAASGVTINMTVNVGNNGISQMDISSLKAGIKGTVADWQASSVTA